MRKFEQIQPSMQGGHLPCLPSDSEDEAEEEKGVAARYVGLFGPGQSSMAPTCPLETEGLCFQVAVAESVGGRPTMEDAACVVLRAATEECPSGWGFFGVFDGHGGAECSRFCSAAFSAAAEAAARPFDSDEFTAHCIATDQAWMTTKAQNSAGAVLDPSGSTGAMAAVWHQGEGIFRLRAGNVGDSRVIPVRRCGSAVTAEAVTADHKPADPEEAARIRAAGAWVSGGRVKGLIAVARAFGDAYFKDEGKPPAEQVITCVPTVTEAAADPPLRVGDFVVVCCDGVFEGDLSRQQCAERVAAALGPPADNSGSVDAGALRRAAEGLVQYALESGSRDNITVMVVALRLLQPGDIAGAASYAAALAAAAAAACGPQASVFPPSPSGRRPSRRSSRRGRTDSGRPVTQPLVQPHAAHSSPRGPSQSPTNSEVARTAAQRAAERGRSPAAVAAAATAAAGLNRASPRPSPARSGSQSGPPRASAPRYAGMPLPVLRRASANSPNSGQGSPAASGRVLSDDVD
eukprot:TRINITY_DN8299_c1_g1_i2.p1 TRINITY_DN8299_c1_g1~~TRINITY_DN8299_c1_g1_i2.p1  ORF type:complete len:588 (+),score=111.15 TRINITY_DN8299_c1_g1_i2:208-1764(+)